MAEYDIVGEELPMTEVVSGDEPETGFLPAFRFPFFGGAPRQAPQRGLARAVPPAPAGPQAVPAGPRGILRRQILPIPATDVPANGSVVITLQPQRAFRVERLVLASTVSPTQCVVSDISVGASRQFVSAGDVPLAAFSPDAVGTGLRGDTASPGTTVTVTLRNLSSMLEKVSGAFFGEALE